MKGWVFDVQRFSVHDGPGIRTTIFFKGCPLRCPWCHNPEGLSRDPSLQYLSEACIGCGACGDRRALSDANACPSGALKVCGYEAEAEELLRIVERDMPFYGSTGGMTLSGGECLLQADFAAALLMGAKKRGLHTAVDTCGCVPRSALEAIEACCDLYLYDVKCASPSLHKAFTGVENGLILENLRHLSEGRKPLWIRIPVIPTFNTSREEMEAMADIIAPLNVERVTLMPYHSLGASKYQTLGLTYPFDPGLKVSEEEMDAYRRIFASRHIKIV